MRLYLVLAAQIALATITPVLHGAAVFESYTKQRRGFPWGKVVLAIIGLAVIALAIDRVMKHVEAERDRRTLDDYAAFASPPRNVPSEPRLAKLPGMSIEVQDELAITGDYDRGNASGAVWYVMWNPAVVMATAEDMPHQAAELVRSSGLHAGPIENVEVDHVPGFLVEFSGATHVMYLVTTCGDRAIAMRAEATREVMDRARATFHCTPDPARSLWRAAAVEPRAGWHRTPVTVAVQLTNDNVVITLVATPDDAEKLPAFHGGMLLGPDREQHGAYTIQRGTARKDDNTDHPGAVITWQCPARHATGYAYVSQWGPSGLDDGIALALTGRCLGVGEAMPGTL